MKNMTEEDTHHSISFIEILRTVKSVSQTQYIFFL